MPLSTLSTFFRKHSLRRNTPRCLHRRCSDHLAREPPQRAEGDARGASAERARQFRNFRVSADRLTRWQVGDDDSRGFLGRGTDLPRSSRPARGCCGRVLRPAAAAGPAGVRCLPSSSWRSGSRLGNALRTTRLPRGRATPPDGRSAEAVTERLLDLGTGRPCPLDQIRTLQRGGVRGTLRMIRSEAEP